MVSVKKVFKDNNSTFYDYSTNRKTSVYPRLVLMTIFTGASSLLVFGDITNFINGIITVQSILIGFSFSVMFFLVQSTVESINVRDSLEGEIKEERLNKLSKELFYNLSYFNMVAVACIIAALLILIPSPDGAVISALSLLSGKLYANALDIYTLGRNIGEPLARWALFFFSIESGYTFARTVGRVNYLFEQKLGKPGSP